MNTRTALRALAHYVGKVQTIRNEARTRRALDSLPASLRKDIGWPDRYQRHG
jgi:uncharacterized protein YjiS (DUF1127 family)